MSSDENHLVAELALPDLATLIARRPRASNKLTSLTTVMTRGGDAGFIFTRDRALVEYPSDWGKYYFSVAAFKTNHYAFDEDLLEWLDLHTPSWQPTWGRVYYGGIERLFVAIQFTSEVDLYVYRLKWG